MKEIELTRGHVTQVDDDDFDELDKHLWHAVFNGTTKLYAGRKVGGRKNARTILMHRVLLEPLEEIEVDHIDGDGLNNQRHNLRLATDKDQQGNKIGHGQSGVKGVRQKPSGRYEARLDDISLGTFDTIEEAAATYATAACSYFGEFAFTGEETKK